MASSDRQFEYLAIDAAGRRVKGRVAATNAGGAFERLRREGLSPLRLRPASENSEAKRQSKRSVLTDRVLAELLSDLAALLRAGSDIRSALAIIGGRSGHTRMPSLCRTLATEIGGGEALDRAFARNLSEKQTFVAALVAAGEASGDLAGGLERATDMLETRIQLSDQMVSVLSYPVFVLMSAIIALGIILLFVVPSLEPLAEAPGANPGLAMQILLSASEFLRSNLTTLGLVGAVSAIVLAIGSRTGLLAAVVDPLLFDGPTRRTIGGLVYGGFAIALGNMLAAGAPMSEALRLAVSSVRSSTAQRRLESVGISVRQGMSVSDALDQVRGFPPTVLRLAAIGEASGALGQMLARAGNLEEKAALRRLAATGRIAGPLLIVLLGALIGLLMAGLLSGVTQLGQTALE